MNDLALFMLRTISSLFMLFAHGLPKINKLFSSSEISFPDPLGVGTFPSFVLVVFSEVICSTLLALGLLTRASLIPLIITMAVAAFIFHANDPFTEKEKALLFLSIYVYLFITGAGKYSLSRFVKIKSSNKIVKFLEG